ncbi:MAG: hypothetical protein ABJO09_19335 [Hyphomicrobiales bacterium]
MDQSSLCLPILTNSKQQKSDLSTALAADAECLSRFIRTKNADGLCKFLIPSADPYYIRLCLLLLRTIKHRARFSLRILYEGAISALSKDETSQLKAEINAKNVELLTETPSLSRRLVQAYQISVEAILLLPCALMPDDKVKFDRACNGTQVQHFKIGYLGGLRTEKGQDQLPKIVTQLAMRLKERNPDFSASVLYQTHRKRRLRVRNLRFDLKMLKASISAWRQGNPVKLVKLEATLSEAQFKEILQTVDLLLIPYNLDAYAHRGSGLIIDGVLAQKPIVATRGLGMADLLAFGSALDAASASEFAEKIIQLMQNYDQFKQHTGLARKAVLQQLTASQDYLQHFASAD